MICMMWKRGTNIANAVLSCLLLVSGVLTAALVATFFSKTVELAKRSGSSYPVVGAFWAIGLAYIIPGLVGAIASGLRRKGWYIAQMVLMIISLLIMIFAFYFAFAVVVVAGGGQRPNCSGELCPLLKMVYNLSLSVAAFLIIGWITGLAATITGGMLAFRTENDEPNSYGTTTVLQMDTPRNKPPQGYVYGGQPVQY